MGTNYRFHTAIWAPCLLESGAIDYDAFAAIYEKGNNPLPADQAEILQSGSGEQIVITAENAHFLLNFSGRSDW